MKYLMKGNTMNTNQFTGSLREWIEVVRAELLVELERVRALPEFQQWAARTIAANIDQPNIPQWNEDDCAMFWVVESGGEFTPPPIDAPRWATSVVIRPEERDASAWTIRYSAQMNDAEIVETFAVDDTGTITYHDTLLKVEPETGTGEEQVVVELGQVDKLVATLTAVQRMVGGQLRTGEQMRDEADELYRQSYVVDAEQGNPVTPDEADTFVGKFDEDNHDCHRFAMPNGSATVYVWHNTGAAPDLSVNVEQSNLNPGEVTRIVRALRAAEAFYSTLTARPNLRPVN